jgi:hypothetical protein
MNYILKANWIIALIVLGASTYFYNYLSLNGVFEFVLVFIVTLVLNKLIIYLFS